MYVHCVSISRVTRNLMSRIHSHVYENVLHLLNILKNPASLLKPTNVAFVTKCILLDPLPFFFFNTRPLCRAAQRMFVIALFSWLR